MKQENTKPSIKDSLMSFISDYNRFQIAAVGVVLVFIVVAVILKKLFF